jgi:SAM-dependent methyltransferase
MATLIHESSEHYERGGTQKDHYAADEVIEVPCPYCGSARRERLFTEHGSVGVSRCTDCTLMYTSPRIKSPEQVYWGDADKYAAEARLVFAGTAPHHRDVNYDEELRLVRKYKPSGRFLDVGCNMGFLLRKVREMGWDAVGVEPSPSLSKLATEKWHIKVHNCFLHEMPESERHSFDVVAFSDVFEHITEPLPFLDAASRMLKDDGIVFIKVPNGRFSLFKQRMAERLGKKPSAGIWDSYEHVVHYTDETIKKMLEKGGFDVVTTTFGRPVHTPVWHDHVGHFYIHPSPWYFDWKRHLGREAFYFASFPERILRGGRVGALPQNLVVIARKRPKTNGAVA